MYGILPSPLDIILLGDSPSKIISNEMSTGENIFLSDSDH